MEIARLAERIEHFGFHASDARERQRDRLSRKA
jgi:hypothetical protein